MAKNAKTIWTMILAVIVLALFLVVACPLSIYMFYVGDDPYGVIDVIPFVRETYEYTPPYEPLDPTIVADETTFFFGEGLTFEMPVGFVVEDPRVYATMGGTHFDYYYRNYEIGAWLRIRHLDFSTMSGEYDEMATGKRLRVFVDSYLYVTLGYEVPGDIVSLLNEASLAFIGADDGYVGLYDTASSKEYVLFLGKKPGHIYHICISFDYFDTMESQIAFKTLTETLNLKGEKVIREVEEEEGVLDFEGIYVSK
ncbi:MAG: hypothetical protein GY771_08205 [bacterium]|nr:hypothetical protein [bacterium]